MTTSRPRHADPLAAGTPARAGSQPLHTAVGGASILAGVFLSWFVAQHSLIGARWTLMVLLALWAAVWVLGSRSIVRLVPARPVVVAVVVAGAAIRLAAATGTTPSISADLYRYSWDAHVQLAGTDPYRYPPDAPQLRSLRRPPWNPTPAGCRHIRRHPGCTTIDRSEVRTIYPPVAEAWFDVVYLAWPGREGSRPWQIAGGLVDDAVVVLLAVSLRRSGRDPREVAWYAFCPAPVVEFAGNGHVDGLALLALVAAVMALRRDRPALAGVLIGAATMIKLYPAAALVAGWRKGRLRMLFAFAAVVAATEAPHVAAVGWHILGYLPGYLREEHYESGARYLLVGLLPIPAAYVTTLAAAVVAAAVVWVLRYSAPGRAAADPAVGLTVILAAVIFVASPVQPWYAVTLGGVAMMLDAPWMLLASLAGEPYYAAVILADRHQVGIGRLAYLAAGAGVLIGWWQRRRRSGPVRAGRSALSGPTR